MTKLSCNQLVLVLLELNSFISIFQERSVYFFFYSDYFLFHSKKTIGYFLFCSAYSSYCMHFFCWGFRHPHHNLHHNHLRLLTSASGCNIPFRPHNVKVFLLQKQPAFLLREFRHYCNFHYCNATSCESVCPCNI